MIKVAVVIIPAFQPTNILISITDQLWSMGYRIVIVDDGSGKAYQEIFEAISDIAIILHHPQNKGKGAAIKTALAYIKDEMWDSEVIGVMDADGQHSTKDMQKVLEYAQEHPKAFVLGARNISDQMPLKSRIGNTITKMFFHLISGVNVSDTQTGLRAFSPDFIGRLLAVKGTRYEYETQVLLEMARENIPIEEVEVQTIYHDKNNSCSHFNVIWDSLRIYKELFKFTLSSFSSFIVDYILFVIVMMIFPHTAPFVLVANVGARILSALYNYSINCSFVFHVDRKKKTAAQYMMLAIFILVMNSLILEFLVQILAFSVYPAKIITEMILFLISWLVQKSFIFKNKISVSDIADGRTGT